jgi:hypothetical protein
MGEGEGTLLQQAGADQQLGSTRRLGRPEPRQRRRLPEVGASEHGHGTGETHRVLSEPAELQECPPSHLGVGQPVHPFAHRVDRRDPLVGERGDERTDQEGSTAGHLAAGGREAPLGL